MNFVSKAALFFVGMVCFTLSANAQELLPQPQQIQLSQKMVENFISAQADLSTLSERIYGHSPYTDAKLHAEIDAIAKKHGFSDFTEFDNASYSIMVVFPNVVIETGEYIDTKAGYRKDLESVKSDASIPESDKMLIIAELEKVIELTEDVLPGNVELVVRNRHKLNTAL